MATVKVNSRSPYYVVASGADGGTIENASVKIVQVTDTGDKDGPISEIYATNITLKVVANNFTPVSYSWTGGSIAGNTNKQIDDFTETGATDQTITYGVTATDSAGNTYPAEFKVSWSEDAQYEALFQLTDNVVGPSQGYTITGTPALTFNSSTEKYEVRIPGKNLENYSFAYSVSVDSKYNQDLTLTFSPASPITGTFGTSNVTETATLSGTISLDANYVLTRSTSNVIEGNTFDIFLNTENVPDGTSVPFTITGVQAADLQREGLNGSFVIGDTAVSNECVRTFQTVTDFVSEGDETFTLTLNDITPTVSISVLISDSNTNQAQTVQVSADGYYDGNNACSASATEDAHYGLATSQAFGNGVILYKDTNLTQPYTSTGDNYKIGSNHRARIGRFNPGEITGYVECPVVDDEEDVLDQEVDLTCTIVNFQVANGVTGQPVSFTRDIGEVSGVSPATYQFGSTTYTATIVTPSNYKNSDTNPTITCDDTATGTSPITGDCSVVGFSVADGATGESVSFSSNLTISSVSPSTYTAGSNTYTATIVIPAGYLNAGSTITCTDTATGSTTPTFPCTTANFQVTNNGTVNTAVQHSVSAGTVVSVSPSVYQRGTRTYTATITIPSGYQNSGSTITCTDSATGIQPVTDSNSITISSTNTSTTGASGELPCDLEADTIVYYAGTIQDGTSLYTNPERTAPFGGADLWHKLVVPNSDGELIDRYARIYSYPPGQINDLSQCGLGTGTGTGTGGTPAASVTISASNDDKGSDAHASFTYQRTTLTATTSNINSPSYQWYKGNFPDGGTDVLTEITGETSSQLIINGGSGETQTTTGNVYYNCLVNDTHEADANYYILWDTRPSFSLKYYSSGAASINACTGTSVTLYGDRDGSTAFCNASKFYSNPAGSSSPSVSVGTYSDSTTGTNGNFRYIEASGIPTGCVDWGCAGPPATQPTTGTIQKVYARRCQNQDSPGRYEYFLFDGFEGYVPGQHILDIKDVGQVGGRGCYELIEEFADTYTLPDGYIRIELTDLERQQPYPDCDECTGTTPPVVEEPEPEITFYYARFIDCGQDGGSITPIYSTGQISTNLVIKTNNVCKEYLDNVQVDGAFNLSNFTTFFGCASCQESIPTQDPTPTISYFRKYGDCATGGSDILKDYGSTSDLGVNWPSVINDNGVCMQDLGNAGTNSTVNVLNLISFEDCATCNESVNPTPEPEPDPTPTITKFRVSSTTNSTSSGACSTITVFDVKLAYSGTLGDGTRLYTNDTLTNLYTPTSTNFVKSDAGAVFRIGVNNPGEVSNYVIC
jgi:hypothetical protein